MSGAGTARLLADVGGTHSRLAWQDAAGSDLADLAAYGNDGFASLGDVVRRYLADHHKTAPQACAIGIATPVTGDHVQMTNRDWSFSIAELGRDLGIQRLRVINDFTALALALPSLAAAHVHQVGGHGAQADAPRALLGPGTGLGVSGLLYSGPRWVPLAGEGGHVTLAAADDDEERVVARLRARFGHASAERALSGPGLENLYQAVCAESGAVPRALAASAITAEALARTDAHCVRSIELFFGLLGGVAGNLALTLGARGGVYLGGGIVPRLGDWIDRSRFRERFEAKGRFAQYLAAIPVYVIADSARASLLGAARALDQD